MDIVTAFRRMGARADVRPTMARSARPIAIDVLRDRVGERFDVALRDGVEAEVIDLDIRDRHLLLLARVDAEKPRFLCGHDERHWFAAAIPEATPVSTVEGAKLALRPEVLRRLPSAWTKRLAARRSVDFIRQGEWFFVPRPDWTPGRLDPIRRNEPISRGAGSTPHVASEAVRTGGRTVYVPRIDWRSVRDAAQIGRLNERFGGGVSEREMRSVALRQPSWRWTPMLRDPELYVRGPVRHPDHATVALRGWHRVLMNTESLARAASNVVFLD
jgi:hypothetical protein